MVIFLLMIRRQPRATRTDTLFPDTTLFRSAYCIDDAVRRKFLTGEHNYERYTVTHLAAPESGWRGPVGHYRLVVDKRATANFVAFCPLAARKIGRAHV